MKGLLVFDDNVNPESLVRALKPSSGELVLCPMTTNQKVIDKVMASLREGSFKIGPVLPYVRLFNDKSFALRQQYLKFIADFGRAVGRKNLNLIRYFKLPFDAASAWWFSLVAEKNTLKSNAYRDLVALLVFIEQMVACSCDTVYLDIPIGPLSRAIQDNSGRKTFSCFNLRPAPGRSYLRFFTKLAVVARAAWRFWLFLLRVLMIRLFLGNRQERLARCSAADMLLMTYFPLVDKKALANKRYLNKYYGPLQKAVEKKYSSGHCWLAMCVNIDGYDLRGSLTLGREINDWGQQLVFLEEWLTFSDLLRAFFSSIVISLKYLKKAAYIRRSFRFPLLNAKIWQIFERDWQRSFSGLLLFGSLLWFCAYSRLFGSMKNNAIITYLFENHAWEKALNLAAKTRPGLRVIGLQHASSPLLLLNLFNDKSELTGDAAGLPRPDYLACLGKQSLKLFADVGWESDRLINFGSLRFVGLKKYLEKELAWNNREKKVVVGLSVNKNETKEILSYVHQACSGQQEYQVVLKPHPALPVEGLFEELGISLDADIFCIVKTPLSDMLSKARAFVVGGSTAALESIACQCPVVIPRLVSVVDMNPLSGISSLPVYVSGPEELRQQLSDIVARTGSPISYDEARSFISEYFEFPQREDVFLKKLEDLS